MPPHSGHRYLIDVARGVADRLTVVLCSLSWEPIPGELRFAWLRELCGDTVRVVHITEEIPAARRDQAGATAIWADAVRRYVSEPVDAVFASESYGTELALHLNARFIAVDPARASIPVSASAIRENPFGYWRFLSAPVRAYYAVHVALIGPAAVAVAMAQRHATVVVAAAQVPDPESVPSPAGDATVHRATVHRYTMHRATVHRYNMHRATVAALSRAANRLVFHAVDSLNAADLCARSFGSAASAAPAAAPSAAPGLAAIISLGDLDLAALQLLTTQFPHARTLRVEATDAPDSALDAFIAKLLATPL